MAREPFVELVLGIKQQVASQSCLDSIVSAYCGVSNSTFQ